MTLFNPPVTVTFDIIFYPRESTSACSLAHRLALSAPHPLAAFSPLAPRCLFPPVEKYRYQEEEGASPGAPKVHPHPCTLHQMGVARELRDGGTLGRDGGTLGRDGGTLGREGGTLGRDGGTLGREGGTLGRDGGTLGRDGGTLGRDGGTLGRDGGILREGCTWRREGGGAGATERDRDRSLGRDGSLGCRGDLLRGAELVQVAERQLNQIQHVHGYVSHTHVTPPQVESPEAVFHEEAWPHPEGGGLNEVPAPLFSSLYSHGRSYYQVTPPPSPPHAFHDFTTLRDSSEVQTDTHT
ncbi:Discs large 1-like protein [Liparis tanakae]|uniref:Discs large 1-like protein n=1 Tax=Liparis tanakae TaxID=230148 RepID=A0A4Z2FCJ4_9TELE|nr:Discs large 1-like protein [Liparis tanakae]